MTRETYLTHYIMQSGSWIKVAEYALADRDSATRKEAELRASFPNDTARFEVR